MEYLYKNKREGDCRMVSLANAYTYFTGKPVRDGLYEQLADKCGCVAGSCINLKPAFEALELEVKETWPYLVSPDGLLEETTSSILPLEINVWHKYYGFHSILAVDWEPRTRSFKVTNFRHVANTDGWIFYEDLMHYDVENPDKKMPRWRCRTIGRK